MPATSWAVLPEEQGDEDSVDEESLKPNNSRRKTLREFGVGRTRYVSQDMEERFTNADSESVGRPTRTTRGPSVQIGRGEDATCWSRTQELWTSVCERSSFQSFWNQRRDMGTAYRRRKVKASEQASASAGGAVYEMDWRQTKTEAGQLSVFFPRELWKQVFDACVLLATVYSVIALPFRIGFNAPAEGWLLVLELMISVLFCLDIPLNLNTAYLEGRFWMTDRWLILSQYMYYPRASKSCLWIDLPSAAPFELVQLAYAFEAQPATLSWLRVMQLMRMARLLALDWRVYFQVRRYDVQTITKLFSGILGGMARMILVMLYWVHILGCGFFYVSWQGRGKHEGAHRAWIEEYEDGFVAAEGTSNFDRYIVAVYWSMGMVTGLEVDVVPENQPERIYAIISNIICAMVLAYVVAGVTDALAAARAEAPPVEDVKEFSRWHALPVDLSKRVTEYAEYYWHERPLSRTAELQVLSTLRPGLRHDVFMHILSDSVDRYNLFTSFEGATTPQGLLFREAIYMALMPCCFERGELIVKQGEPHDAIYFLRVDQGHNSSCVDARLTFVDNGYENPGEHHVLAPPKAKPQRPKSRTSKRSSIMYLDAPDNSAVMQRFASYFAPTFRYFGEESINRGSSCPVDLVADTRVDAYTLSVSAIRKAAAQAFPPGSSELYDIERVLLRSLLLKTQLRFAQFEQYVLGMNLLDPHAVDPRTLYLALRVQRMYQVRQIMRLFAAVDEAQALGVSPGMSVLPQRLVEASAADVREKRRKTIFLPAQGRAEGALGSVVGNAGKEGSVSFFPGMARRESSAKGPAMPPPRRLPAGRAAAGPTGGTEALEARLTDLITKLESKVDEMKRPDQPDSQHGSSPASRKFSMLSERGPARRR